MSAGSVAGATAVIISQGGSFNDDSFLIFVGILLVISIITLFAINKSLNKILNRRQENE